MCQAHGEKSQTGEHVRAYRVYLDSFLPILPSLHKPHTPPAMERMEKCPGKGLSAPLEKRQLETPPDAGKEQRAELIYLSLY